MFVCDSVLVCVHTGVCSVVIGSTGPWRSLPELFICSVLIDNLAVQGRHAWRSPWKAEPALTMSSLAIYSPVN